MAAATPPRPSLLLSRSTSSARSWPPTRPPARRWSPAFRPSPTATCTSATPRPSASTSASPTSIGGCCNLRFDDTNPVKEDVEYVDSIKDDVHWLGFDWAGREFYASDYYEQLYQDAEGLIRSGAAYVDSHSADEIRAHRGTLTEPGTDSPYRVARRRREPRSVPPHARRRVRRRHARAAREDRHGVAQHQPARSGALPHPPCRTSPHRQRLVHLPDVRLRASAVGRV